MFKRAGELGTAAPGTAVVVAGNREIDMYELLQRQSRHCEEAGLVVRANWSRQRNVKMWDA